MSKYFGFLENDKFITWEKKKQVDYLVSKKACCWSTIIKAAINENVLFGDLNEAKYVFKPSNETIEEFHEFIVMKYDRLISIGFISFFRDFNNSVFGLSIAEQKRLALNNFNEIYKKVDVTQIEIITSKKKLGIIEDIKNCSRFEKLHHIRSAKKAELCPLPIAMEFFYGNEDFFNSEIFKDLDFFKEVISFETDLKILVNLNNRYQFEDDFYFNEDSELKCLYKKYGHIFLTYEAFVWTHKAIPNFKEIIPAQINSLYEALKRLELIVINRKSNFENYIRTEHHRVNFSKIRQIDVEINLDHGSRVEIFMRELPKKSKEK